MKRSLQEIVELVIFALIALVVGTGLLWVFGWLLGLVGIIFKFIAGLIWIVLRYILPVAIVAAVIFFLIRFVTNRSKKPAEAAKAAAVTIDAESSDAAEKVEEVAETVVEKAENATEAVAETAEEVKDATVEKVEELKEAVVETTDDVKEAAAEKVEELKDSINANESESDDTKKE